MIYDFYYTLENNLEIKNDFTNHLKELLILYLSIIIFPSNASTNMLLPERFIQNCQAAFSRC